MICIKNRKLFAAKSQTFAEHVLTLDKEDIRIETWRLRIAKGKKWVNIEKQLCFLF